MYVCDDTICDPLCDFCWYCIHGEYGEPAQCGKMKPDFGDGMGYCDEFKTKIDVKVNEKVAVKQQNKKE